MKQNKRPNKKPNWNPFCNRCKMPMKKKGATKLGEKRFRCHKCGFEK